MEGFKPAIYTSDQNFKSLQTNQGSCSKIKVKVKTKAVHAVNQQSYHKDMKIMDAWCWRLSSLSRSLFTLTKPRKKRDNQCQTIREGKTTNHTPYCEKLCCILWSEWSRPWDQGLWRKWWLRSLCWWKGHGIVLLASQIWTESSFALKSGLFCSEKV